MDAQTFTSDSYPGNRMQEKMTEIWEETMNSVGVQVYTKNKKREATYV